MAYFITGDEATAKFVATTDEAVTETPGTSRTPHNAFATPQDVVSENQQSKRTDNHLLKLVLCHFKAATPVTRVCSLVSILLLPKH
jgi:hypothetical protein